MSTRHTIGNISTCIKNGWPIIKLSISFHGVNWMSISMSVLCNLNRKKQKHSNETLFHFLILPFRWVVDYGWRSCRLLLSFGLYMYSRLYHLLQRLNLRQNDRSRVNTNGQRYEQEKKAQTNKHTAQHKLSRQNAKMLIFHFLTEKAPTQWHS